MLPKFRAVLSLYLLLCLVHARGQLLLSVLQAVALNGMFAVDLNAWYTVQFVSIYF